MAKIRIVARTPQQPCQIVEIDNTLEGMRAAIGCGWLQAVPLALSGGIRLDLYCDEEGKLKRLTPNFVWQGDIVCGAVFVAQHDGEGEAVGLSDAEVQAAVEYIERNALW